MLRPYIFLIHMWMKYLSRELWKNILGCNERKYFILAIRFGQRLEK
jgi:hypothetical protein